MAKKKSSTALSYIKPNLNFSKRAWLALILVFLALGGLLVYKSFASGYIAKYQENDNNVGHACGSRVLHTAAHGSGTASYYAWKSYACSNGLHAWYGPYKSLPQGDYWACFILHDSNADYTFDVSRYNTYLKRAYYPTSSAYKHIIVCSNSQWRQQCIDFRVGSGGLSNLEYRLKVASGTVYVDAVEIYHLGDHPYGY